MRPRILPYAGALLLSVATIACESEPPNISAKVRALGDLAQNNGTTVRYVDPSKPDSTPKNMYFLQGRIPSADIRYAFGKEIEGGKTNFITGSLNDKLIVIRDIGSDGVPDEAASLSISGQEDLMAAIVAALARQSASNFKVHPGDRTYDLFEFLVNNLYSSNFEGRQ